MRLGRAPLVIERPRALAADPGHEAVFAARAALKRALAIRRDAELQIEKLRMFIGTLDSEARLMTTLGTDAARPAGVCGRCEP